ncbi:hypothetical protein V6C42_14630 [Pseudoclostridium thermosuccinogenes]|uniref:hypothetical protein n=1 Tax=Clostridium thermosuccinogenes TaxID=84032 RepID=UPI002FD8BDFA
MNIIQEDVITWACNNWYVRPDGLIEVCNQKGQIILFNDKFGRVWENINYETTVGNLWDRIKDFLSWEEFMEVLEQMHKYKLILKINEEDIFESIFC